jgi:hypothetical protein
MGELDPEPLQALGDAVERQAIGELGDDQEGQEAG